MYKIDFSLKKREWLIYHQTKLLSAFIVATLYQTYLMQYYQMDKKKCDLNE